MCGQTNQLHLQRLRLHGLYTIERTKSNASWVRLTEGLVAHVLNLYAKRRGMKRSYEKR